MSNYYFFKRLTKIGWKAGYGYIINGILLSIVLYFMLGTNYYLVKKDDSINVQNKTLLISSNRSIDKNSCNDSINNTYLLQQDPSKESKNNYLSLWAAVLAVIFVVFSIYGVLKLELTKEDIEKKSDSLKKEGDAIKKEGDNIRKEGDNIRNLREDIMKLRDNLNELIKKTEEHSSMIQNISVHFIASSSDTEESRIRRIEEISSIFKDLKNDSPEMDNYELLPAIFSMSSKGNSEESKRMELIINELIANENGSEMFVIDKALLLGKAYYRLYKNNNSEKDLERSLSIYCSLFSTEGKEILSKLSISMITKYKDYESLNELNYIKTKENYYEFCRILYDYALNYCNRELKYYILKQASSILKKITQE